jgi:polysaccharide export outer membrane protein
MNIKVWLLFLLTICSLQIAVGQDEFPVKPELPRGYLVGPGDEITAVVMGEKEFNFVAEIDQDGNFQVPFFDKPVYAQCRTEKELKDEVSKLLSKYLRSPQLSLRITQRKSRPPATIYGEVRQAQQIVLSREARLLELLAFAGGVTEKAGGTIQVFRTQTPMCVQSNELTDWKTNAANAIDVPSRMYSLNSVRQGGEESNPVIYPGDIIVVQEALPVYVIGEVRATGKLLLPEGGLPLSQAIASVGGVNREAKTKNVKIYRLKANSKDREIIAANYDLIRKGQQKDVMLEPYDIIEVDKSKKNFGEILLEIATGGIKSAANVLPTNVLR